MYASPHNAPHVGILGINAQGPPVGLDGLGVALEFVVCVPNKAPVRGFLGINAQGLPVSLDGLGVALESVVCECNLPPVNGILGINAQGLPVGLDGLGVAPEFAVCDPETNPSPVSSWSLLSPLLAPVQQFCPVLCFLQGNGPSSPFAMATPLSRFLTRLNLPRPLHRHSEVEALPPFDIQGGEAHQPALRVEQSTAAGTGRNGGSCLDEGWRAAAQLRNNTVGEGQFQPAGRDHGIDRLAHFQAHGLAQLRRFGG